MRALITSLLVLGSAAVACRAADPARPRNVILFVADGLRHGSVDTPDMPTFAEVRRDGVNFVNSHSLFPTVTTPNASAIATGHYLGDTGDFANNLFLGYLTRANDPSHIVESNIELADMNAHFDGNYLGETTLLAAARGAGMRTAIVGKHGPALIQDATRNNADITAANVQTIVIDDATGYPARNGERIAVPLPTDFSRRLTNDPYFQSTYFNGIAPAGDPRSPAARVINVPQQKYFADVFTRAVLPSFGAPDGTGHIPSFVAIFWSRDPDMTQHYQTDSPNRLVPGINGPSVSLALQNVDANLRQILDYLRATPDPADPAHKLADTTDLFITSDHGFGTISRSIVDNDGRRADSFAIRQRYQDVAEGLTPPGVTSLDLAHDLDLPLYDGDGPVQKEGDAGAPPTLQFIKRKLAGTGPGDWAQHPGGSALLGGAGTYRKDQGFDASLIVIGDAIYVPHAGPADEPTRTLIRRAVAALAAQPYVSGIFVDTERFGPIPGALSLNDVNLRGSARTPIPAILVSARSFSTDPANPFMTGVEVADTGMAQGLGMHGSFGRHDTYNCMMALGPDFKARFADPDPVSNADVAVTFSKILGLDLLSGARGNLHGRVLAESFANGPGPRGAQSLQKKSDPAPTGQSTYLQYQMYTDEAGHRLEYFDAAGFPGATVGLREK